MHAQNATATGGAFGFAAVWNSMVLCSQSTASGQTGFGYYAANNSMMVATASAGSTFSPPINTLANLNGFISF